MFSSTRSLFVKYKMVNYYESILLHCVSMLLHNLVLRPHRFAAGAGWPPKTVFVHELQKTTHFAVIQPANAFRRAKSALPILCFSIVALLPFYIQAQEATPKKRPSADITVGSVVSSGGQTPFWLRARQYGTMPMATGTPPLLRFEASLHAGYSADSILKRNKKKWDWSYGLAAVANVGAASRVILPEYYVKLKYRSFEGYVGRQREVVGLVDTALTMGAYSWSGNALPMPKVQLGFIDYTPLKFTKGLVAFKGWFAHGIFDDTFWVQHALLHQKQLYLRVGKPNWRVKLYGGINHQVMWGGRSAFYTNNGKPPGDLRAYFYVVTGLRLTGEVDNPLLTNFDATNRIGNHLGTVDVGATIDFDHSTLFGYRQSIFEDGSLFYLTSIIDGLNGVSWQNKRQNYKLVYLKKITAEYLYTKSQGGSVFGGTNLLRGKDNYFNHGQFKNGWSYMGRGIGTPFITPNTDTQDRYPFNGFEFTNNNRVAVFHLAAEAIVNRDINVTIRGSWSNNLGNYDVPFPNQPQQFSGLFTCQVPTKWLGGSLLSTSLAVDNGQLYQNSAALWLSLKKVWK